MSMHVIKRNGTKEEVSFDKIYKRIKYLVSEPYELKNIETHTIAQHVIQGLYDGVSTTGIDNRSSIVCANLSIQNYEYGILAGRIAINNHQKNTLTSFKDKVDRLYLRKDENGEICPIVSTSFYKFVKKNQKLIENYIDYNRDYYIDFFGFKTLEKSYLLKVGKEIIERPQDLFMRVAIFLHMGSSTKEWKNPEILDNIFETYDLISNKYFTHATPTLFNSGLTRPQLASCYLLGTEDSLEGIFKTATDCAHISKWSGGIGFHLSNWRSSGSLIRGTGGNSSGIIPFLKIFEKIAIAVNQGGRRNGSISPYLEPHHPDILDFLNLSRKNISEEFKANKLYLALWVSDLFMKRVKNDENWSTFCPDACPGLTDCYDEEYEELYTKYENEGKAVWTRKARDIWVEIFKSQKESGFPYILYKDAVNRNSNQKNIGVIKSSNLCSEILEYSSSTEYAVCSLTSICLPRFVEDTYTPEELEVPEEERRPLNHEFPKHSVFNYEKFKKVVAVCVRNLDKVIDYNYYPVPETKRSNFRHRPIGIGVQGLADVFFKFNVTFGSDEAKQLNKYIFETMYYAAVSESSKIARKTWMKYKQECDETGKVVIQTNPVVLDTGKVTYTKTEYTNSNDIPKTIGAYPSYLENGGSPLSKGIFHWQMMGLEEKDLITNYDWDSLREHIQQFGVVNSLLIALMPTASTSQIMGNIECFEPLMSNVFIRNTLAGEFVVVNKYLIHDLSELGLWSKRIENYIKLNNGSIQSIEGIPEHIKNKYKTVWELSQRFIIDLAADRSPFVYAYVWME
jgi:ribonucleoside-diphosphate reductase alpha subunit